jgi:hypothetical protein
MAVTQLNPVSSTPTPPGAETVVAQGLANAGVYSANLSAGTYVIDCDGYGTDSFANGFSINSSYGVTGKKTQIGTNAFTNPVYVKLDSADPAFTILSQPNVSKMNSMVGNTSTSLATNGSGTFIAVTSDGTNWTSYKSTDYGATWASAVSTGVTVASMATLTGIVYLNSVWFIFGTNGIYSRSTDNGATWSAGATLGAGNQISAITYGAGVYVAVTQSATTSTNVYSSTNGSSWTARTGASAQLQHDVYFDNSLFVAVGAAGTVQTSTDGTTWTSRTSGVSTTNRNVIYGNGTWVVVGAGSIISSTNGTTWTTRANITGKTSGETFSNSYFGALVYGGGYFWAHDSITNNERYSSILISPDGTNWAKCMISPPLPDSTDGSIGNISNGYNMFANSHSAIYDGGFYSYSKNSATGAGFVLYRMLPMFVSIYSVSGTALN